MVLDRIQAIQEEEYNFPYHHIPIYRKGFSQCYNFTWGINYAATLEFLHERLKLESFQSLIDVGCGDGRLTQEVQTDFPDKIVAGVDYSIRSINIARALNPTGTYYDLNIIEEQLPRRYDIALLVEVFEHIPPELGDSFLKSVANLLEDGGLLLLTVPHANKPTEVKHYRHFTLATLSECLAPYFEIIETIPFEKIDWRKDFLDTILTNKLFILNHYRLRHWVYRYYKKFLFYAEREEACKRLFVKAKVKGRKD